jgi:hypothetical protein
MPKSYQQSTSNGTTNSFPWSEIDGYLQLSHIKVYVNGTLQATSAYSIDASARTVAFVPNAPASGSVVRIQRETPSTVAGRVVDFVDGSVLTAADLDAANLQTIFLAQEAADKGGDAFQKNSTDTAWLGQNIRISQVAAPTAGTDAVTKDYVDALSLAGGLGGAPVADPQAWVFSGTGSQTEFTLTNPTPNATQANMFLVEVGGVLQHPGTNYTITSAGVLTFTGTAPPAPGTNQPPNIRVRNFGIARSVNETVTTAMLQLSAVTADRIAPNAITTDKVATSGIAGTKVQGWYSFTPRFTLTWYPNDISSGASPVWMKKELPLATGVTNPYFVQYGRALTFGTNPSSLTTIVWGRIALNKPTAPTTSVIDATKIPGFFSGYPAQIRIDGLPQIRDSQGGLVTIPFHSAWPNTWAGQDTYPEAGAMGVGQWLNGVYRDFQAETTSGYSAPPLQASVSHWHMFPDGGLVGGNPVSGGTNEANILLQHTFINPAFSVYAGSSGTTPYTGPGGASIPSSGQYKNWMPATALLGPDWGGRSFICDVMFVGIYGGG